MRKLLGILFFSFLLSCTNKLNTPRGEIESLFDKYISLDKEVISQLNETIDAEDLSETQKNKYKDIFKNQYKNIKYNIVDEVINDTNAVVTVEIDVYDLETARINSIIYLDLNPEAFNNADGIFNESKYWDYRLDEMEHTEDRIKYMLELSLTKIDNKWRLDNLLNTERQKIHGLYQK